MAPHRPLLSVVFALSLIACGGSRHADTAVPAGPQPLDEQMLGLLPQGAQIIAELDLARLRANPVVGGVVTKLLDEPGSLPTSSPPLARAKRVVLAAYGVGTAQAATVTLVATTEPGDPVEGGRKIADGIFALGPAEWLDQISQRAGIAAANGGRLAAADDVLKLRNRAEPAKAPGASVRLMARLTFDARVSLARQTGLELAPGELSLWGDVVDDLAIVVEADASDPGARGSKQSAQRLTRSLHAALATLAELPLLRTLGLSSSLIDAQIAPHGEWVRLVVTVGPSHLRRVIDRAQTVLTQAPAPGGS